MYANADGIKAKLITSSSNFNDQYILSKLKIAVDEFSKYLDSYDIADACHVVTEFFEVLNNWYIRRSRERFWRSEKDDDKVAAYDTLYTVLYNMCIAASPVLPLTLEYIFLNLVSGEKWISDKSVHLQDYPDVSTIELQKDLVKKIDLVRDVCTSALNIRNKVNIRVRQPLQQIIIVGKGIEFLSEYSSLIKDEINVKEVVISNEVQKYGQYDLKLNFKEIGKRLPHKIKNMIVSLKNGQWQRCSNGQVSIDDEILMESEYTMTLKSSVSEEAVLLSCHDIMVLLNCNITEDLELEGIARDIVRLVQQTRKDADLHVSDYIRCFIKVSEDNKVKRAIEQYKDYIKEQTLSSHITFTENISNVLYINEVSISGTKVELGIDRER